MQNEQTEQDERMIGTRRAAQILGVSVHTVRRHAAELGGRIPFGRWQFPETAVCAAITRPEPRS